MTPEEEDDRLPEIKMNIVSTPVQASVRKLNMKLAPPVTRCGEVITIEGPVRIHECDVTYPGDIADLPPNSGWQVRTTGPGRLGYQHAVCAEHAKGKKP